MRKRIRSDNSDHEGNVDLASRLGFEMLYTFFFSSFILLRISHCEHLIYNILFPIKSGLNYRRVIKSGEPLLQPRYDVLLDQAYEAAKRERSM